MSLPLRVLLVEDVEDDSLLLTHELEKQGYNLHWQQVETGPEMSAALDNQSWDVIIADFKLPRFNALSALKLLQKKGLDIPFIVVSGTIGEDMAVAIMKTGAHDYLMKGHLKRLGPAIEREMKEALVRWERRLANEKLQHLNQVMHAVRNVNQLIVKEKSPDRLLQSVCDNLIETRGLHGAWIFLIDKAGHISKSAQRGFGKEFLTFLKSFASEQPPSCFKKLKKTPLIAVTREKISACNTCPLSPKIEDRGRLVAKLTYQERLFGFFGAVLPPHFASDKQEQDLFMEIAEDISFGLYNMEVQNERERAIEALKESERSFRAIFTSSLDGILLTDASTHKLKLGNQAICRMLGYSRKEIEKSSLKDIFTPESLSKYLHAAETQDKQYDQLASEIPVRRKDGEFFFADISTTSISSNGKAYLVSVFRDVTEKKNLQASLAQTDRLASMGMLAAGVAHEINNPLTYILYNLERLVGDLPSLVDVLKRCHNDISNRLGPETLAEFLGNAKEQFTPEDFDGLLASTKDAISGAHRVRDIVRDLRTFSRVQDDRISLVNIKDVIECSINMVHNEIKYKAQLVKEYEDIPAIMASDGRLSQVFLNLLINAAQSINEGDIEHNTIWIRTWSEPGEVLAEIRDTGKGISASCLEHIFEPFFTTKDVGVGSGLGLSICHNIVTSFGGRIEVESEPGQGSCFVVHLPLTQDEPKAIPASSNQELKETLQSVRGRVLIVDDDPAVGTAISRMLEREHEVVLAPSGIDGKKVLEDDRSFDVILCDLMMPSVSGMDLYDWLESVYPTLSQKIVFMTGGTFTSRSRDFLEQVPNVRLEKPFDPKNLIALVRRLTTATRIESRALQP